MKKVFLSFALLFSASVNAQNTSATTEPSKTWSADLAMWGYYSAENFVPASWNMVYVNDNLFEVRHNFDQSNALSLYYGHRLGAQLGESVDFSFTPALGFTSYGPFSNVGLTTHTIFEGSSWKFYTINQYNVATATDASDITYHWIDFGYHLTDWLLVGASDQYYQANREEGNFDLGPSFGIEVGDFYAKTYGWDLWSEEDRYMGLWCGRYFSNEN